MPGSQSSLREANLRRVLDAVHRFGGITQVELAEATGLSAATVSTIVKQLLGAGRVETRTTTRSGRRAQLVTLVKRSGLVAGVHVGRRALRVVVGNADLEMIGDETLPLPVDHQFDTTLDQLALLVIDLVEQVGATAGELLGIGVAMPAPVRPGRGVVEAIGTLRGWEQVEVAEVLTARLNRPVLIANDADLGALAESRYGASRGFSSSVYVGATDATGAGVVLDGRIHQGRRGIAGEIGHVEVSGSDSICHCGSRGCLNTVVGADALIDRLRISRGRVTLKEIVALAKDGDPGCRQVVADAGEAIGRVVAGLALAVDPECVVVGGELAETGEVLLGPIRDALARRVLLDGIQVRPAQLGLRAEVTGAMALALDAIRSQAPVQVEVD